MSPPEEIVSIMPTACPDESSTHLLCQRLIRKHFTYEASHPPLFDAMHSLPPRQPPVSLSIIKSDKV